VQERTNIVRSGLVEYVQRIVILDEDSWMFGWLRRAPAPPTEQQRQVWQALSEYPPYAPPEWDPDTKSMHDACVEYQKYFFDSKPLRLEALRTFLAKFDTTLDFDDAGIMAVSVWMHGYADLLVRDLNDHATIDAYRGFAPRWTGPLAGLNPIFDLGIYHAEPLVATDEARMDRGARPSEKCIGALDFRSPSHRKVVQSDLQGIRALQQYLPRKKTSAKTLPRCRGCVGARPRHPLSSNTIANSTGPQTSQNVAAERPSRGSALALTHAAHHLMLDRKFCFGSIASF